MRQFGRQLRLEIGNATSGIAISNLRVAFEFQKSIDAKPNPGRIRVWNLNRDHMHQILTGQYDRARLAVGYSELRTIFSGDIIKPRVKREGLDFIIDLECGDGDIDYQTARVATTLKAGATDTQIVGELAKTMTRTSKGDIDVPVTRALPRGKVLVGNTRDVLSKVATNNGADWSVQDGELIMLPAGRVLPGESVLLSQETGMIGAPEATDNGLELACLLNPALRVGGMVTVRSILDYFDGDYKIVNLRSSGDIMGGDWTSKLVVVGGKFEKVEKAEAKK
ncbi:hypothetical protein DAI18_18120 [Microvirgula aerodenitrificans]|uniref:Uncharacterized protein n=1 Tax=Microvirgula aerodenitrificans TaxID=57480 RepID=A0A2S0PEG8_9NEIS|nr:hypothetical protein [Microvirgula aerodenitrificans]AVY95745.1 hypothetical protein DAI18_18120 [Microvirgula aerodenitrificans]